MVMATMDQPQLADMRSVIPMSEFIWCCWLEKLNLICLSKLKTIFSAFHIRGRWKNPLYGGTLWENWWQIWYEYRKGEVSEQKVTLKSCEFTQLCLQSVFIFYWLQIIGKKTAQVILLSYTNQSLSNTRSSHFRGCNFILQSVERFPLVYKLCLRGLSKSKFKRTCSKSPKHFLSLIRNEMQV